VVVRLGARTLDDELLRRSVDDCREGSGIPGLLRLCDVTIDLVVERERCRRRTWFEFRRTAQGDAPRPCTPMIGSMNVSDTSVAARRVLTQVFRRMSPAEKAAMVEQMSNDARELARCGIRSRHPEYRADEVEHALHRLLVGDELADRAWPAHTHLVP